MLGGAAEGPQKTVFGATREKLTAQWRYYMLKKKNWSFIITLRCEGAFSEAHLRSEGVEIEPDLWCAGKEIGVQPKGADIRPCLRCEGVFIGAHLRSKCIEIGSDLIWDLKVQKLGLTRGVKEHALGLKGDLKVQEMGMSWGVNVHTLGLIWYLKMQTLGLIWDVKVKGLRLIWDVKVQKTGAHITSEWRCRIWADPRCEGEKNGEGSFGSVVCIWIYLYVWANSLTYERNIKPILHSDYHFLYHLLS